MIDSVLESACKYTFFELKKGWDTGFVLPKSPVPNNDISNPSHCLSSQLINF
jgi:hypothetical protein